MKHKNYFRLSININYRRKVHIQCQKSVAFHTCRYKVHIHIAEGSRKVGEPDIHPDNIKKCTSDWSVKTFFFGFKYNFVTDD